MADNDQTSDRDLDDTLRSLKDLIKESPDELRADPVDSSAAESAGVPTLTNVIHDSRAAQVDLFDQLTPAQRKSAGTEVQAANDGNVKETRADVVPDDTEVPVLVEESDPFSDTDADASDATVHTGSSDDDAPVAVEFMAADSAVDDTHADDDSAWDDDDDAFVIDTQADDVAAKLMEEDDAARSAFENAAAIPVLTEPVSDDAVLLDPVDSAAANHSAPAEDNDEGESSDDPAINYEDYLDPVATQAINPDSAFPGMLFAGGPERHELDGGIAPGGFLPGSVDPRPYEAFGIDELPEGDDAEIADDISPLLAARGPGSGAGSTIWDDRDSASFVRSPDDVAHEALNLVDDSLAAAGEATLNPELAREIASALGNLLGDWRPEDAATDKHSDRTD